MSVSSQLLLSPPPVPSGRNFTLLQKVGPSGERFRAYWYKVCLFLLAKFLNLGSDAEGRDNSMLLSRWHLFESSTGGDRGVAGPKLLNLPSKVESVCPTSQGKSNWCPNILSVALLKVEPMIHKWRLGERRETPSLSYNSPRILSQWHVAGAGWGMLALPLSLLVSEPSNWGLRKAGALILALSVCCCSVTKSCPTLCNLMDCSTPGFPVLHHFPELTQIHVHRVSDDIQPSHLILCRPLLLLPSIFPSIRVFSNESALHIRWPKYWSFIIILPMNIQGYFL